MKAKRCLYSNTSVAGRGVLLYAPGRSRITAMCGCGVAHLNGWGCACLSAGVCLCLCLLCRYFDSGFVSLIASFLFSSHLACLACFSISPVAPISHVSPISPISGSHAHSCGGHVQGLARLYWAGSCTFLEGRASASSVLQEKWSASPPPRRTPNRRPLAMRVRMLVAATATTVTGVVIVSVAHVVVEVTLWKGALVGLGVAVAMGMPVMRRTRVVCGRQCRRWGGRARSTERPY